MQSPFPFYLKLYIVENAVYHFLTIPISYYSEMSNPDSYFSYFQAKPRRSPLLRNEDEITSPGSLEPTLWIQQSPPGTPRELPWKDAVPIQFYDPTKAASSTLSEFLGKDPDTTQSRRSSSSSTSSDDRHKRGTFRLTRQNTTNSTNRRPKLVSMNSADSKAHESQGSSGVSPGESIPESRVKKGGPGSWLGKGKVDGRRPQLSSSTGSSSSSITTSIRSYEGLNPYDLDDLISPLSQSSEPASYFVSRSPVPQQADLGMRDKSMLSDSVRRRLGIGSDVVEDRTSRSPPVANIAMAKSLPVHTAIEPQSLQNKKIQNLQCGASSEQKINSNSQTGGLPRRRGSFWRRSASPTSMLNAQATRSTAPSSKSSLLSSGPARKSPMRIEITKPTSLNFLASEAQKVATPPITPRVFFHDHGSTADDEKVPRLDYVGEKSSVTLSTNEGRFQVTHSGADDKGTNEWSVPEHLPSSPLCPRHPKHKSGGTGICPYHGSNPIDVP